MCFSALSPELETVCTLGGLSMVLGLIALLRSSGQPRSLGPEQLFIIALVLIVLGGGALAAALPGVIWQSALGLAGVLGLFAVCRSPLTARLFLAGGRLLATPLFQAALLLLIGAGLLAGQVVYLDHNFGPPPLDLSVENLGESQTVLVPSSQRAYTDAGQPVSLWSIDPNSPPETGEDAFFRHDLSLQQRVIRTGEADPSYNCHGWVFTGGRAWVRGVSVPGILADNGYAPVEQPRVGDVAVFRNSDGEVTHTGLVQAVTPAGAILIESKWGRLGRFLHTPTDHAYRSHSLRYFRTSRPHHHLSNPASPAAGQSTL